MPLNETLTEIKKPENYSDGLGTIQNRALWPSEQHANIVAIAKACGRYKLYSGTFTFTAFDGDWVIEINAATSFNLNIVAGAIASGTRVTFIKRGSGTVNLVVATDTNLPMGLGNSVIELVWANGIWRSVSLSGPSAKLITENSTNWAAGDVSIGAMTKNNGTDANTIKGLVYSGSNLYLNATAIKTSGAITSGGNIGVGTIALNASTNEITGASKVYNTVWNDIVDFLELDDETETEPGKVYILEGRKLVKSYKYCQLGLVGLVSDTYGFGVGKKEGKKQAPIAIGGYVLAYVDKVYPSGTALTCSKDGILTKMSFVEKILFPERLIGTFLKEEFGKDWNGVIVNGRHWVKVK